MTGAGGAGARAGAAAGVQCWECGAASAHGGGESGGLCDQCFARSLTGRQTRSTVSRERHALQLSLSTHPPEKAGHEQSPAAMASPLAGPHSVHPPATSAAATPGSKRKRTCRTSSAGRLTGARPTTAVRPAAATERRASLVTPARMSEAQEIARHGVVDGKIRANICPCHQCRGDSVTRCVAKGSFLMACRQPGCDLMYCTGCLEHWYGAVGAPREYMEATTRGEHGYIECCPRCAGLCMCRKCVNAKLDPARLSMYAGGDDAVGSGRSATAFGTGFLGSVLGDEEALAEARYVLACIRRPLLGQAKLQERHARRELRHILAATRDGNDEPSHTEVTEAIEAIPVIDLGGCRMTCTRCKTAIWDIFATCKASTCDDQPDCMDLCLQCCEDIRAEQPGENFTSVQDASHADGEAGTSAAEDGVSCCPRNARPVQRCVSPPPSPPLAAALESSAATALPFEPPALTCAEEKGLRDSRRQARRCPSVARFSPGKEAQRPQHAIEHRRRSSIGDTEAARSADQQRQPRGAVTPVVDVDSSARVAKRGRPCQAATEPRPKRQRAKVDRYDPDKEMSKPQLVRDPTKCDVRSIDEVLQALQTGKKSTRADNHVSWTAPRTYAKVGADGALRCVRPCCLGGGSRACASMLTLNRLLRNGWEREIVEHDASAMEVVTAREAKATPPGVLLGSCISEDEFLACKPEGSEDGLVWSPDWATLPRSGVGHREPGCEEALVRADKERVSRFRREWAAGRPIVVRNASMGSRMSWVPIALRRACMATSKSVDKRTMGDVRVTVVCCELPGEQFAQSSIDEFWDTYQRFDGRDLQDKYELFKLKDWPPGETFGESLPRHEVDFNECLPFQLYTHPQNSRVSLCNLATRLPEEGVLRPDLGPKMYTAFGHREQTGKVGGVGMSCTRLHCDMSDACNVLMHTVSASVDERTGSSRAACASAASVKSPSTSSLAGVGAIWYMWGRDQRRQLSEYLKSRAELYRAERKPNDDADPVHDQTYFVAERQLDELREHGLEPWVIYQRQGDAVVVPAGCPHQVYNLASCIKVAVDFASPENADVYTTLSDEYRGLPDGHRAKEDKLQARTMLVHAAHAALKVVREDAREGAAEQCQSRD